MDRRDVVDVWTGRIYCASHGTWKIVTSNLDGRLRDSPLRLIDLVVAFHDMRQTTERLPAVFAGFQADNLQAQTQARVVGRGQDVANLRVEHQRGLVGHRREPYPQELPFAEVGGPGGTRTRRRRRVRIGAAPTTGGEASAGAAFDRGVPEPESQPVGPRTRHASEERRLGHPGGDVHQAALAIGVPRSSEVRLPVRCQRTTLTRSDAGTLTRK